MAKNRSLLVVGGLAVAGLGLYLLSKKGIPSSNLSLTGSFSTITGTSTTATIIGTGFTPSSPTGSFVNTYTVSQTETDPGGNVPVVSTGNIDSNGSFQFTQLFNLVPNIPAATSTWAVRDNASGRTTSLTLNIPRI